MNLIPITEEILNQLAGHKVRTGVGPDKLLNHNSDVPEDLTPKKIKNWFAGRIKNTRPDHIEYVIYEWEKLPSREFVEITDTLKAKLKKYKRETGIGPYALLRGAGADKPDGLKASVINYILDGSIKKVRKDYLDYITARWDCLRQSKK